jgi:hypothetical protein
MNPFVLVVLGLLVGSGLGIYLYTCWSREPAEEPFQYFRCDQCQAKLRFKISKAGRPGMCPRCKQRWNLPAASVVRS